MAKRYAIWDRKTNIYTPAGEELTPSNWLERYAFLRIPSAVPVVSAGLFNGGFCGELGEMKRIYTNMGATFEDSLTDEELLVAIEEFEDSLKVASSSSSTVSAEERIAAALEAQVMMALPDEEV